jgi:hypothetical protein
MVPEFARLADVVRVVDVGEASAGSVLRILLNSDLDRAMALLAPPSGALQAPPPRDSTALRTAAGEHWRWRLLMAERLAAAIDPDRFDVRAAYVFGSTKNGTAGPASDIDLLFHVGPDLIRREALRAWLDGWSRSLAEVNFLRTGHRSEGLLDAHFVTDEDIAARTSYAVKIGAATDAARRLTLGPDGSAPARP